MRGTLLDTLISQYACLSSSPLASAEHTDKWIKDDDDDDDDDDGWIDGWTRGRERLAEIKCHQ